MINAKLSQYRLWPSHENGPHLDNSDNMLHNLYVSFNSGSLNYVLGLTRINPILVKATLLKTHTWVVGYCWNCLD